MALSGNMHENIAFALGGAYDFDPNATALTDVAWVDASDVEEINAVFIRTVGTSAIVAKWIGNTAADGSGTDVDIVTVTPTAQPNAVNDTAILKCTRADLDAVGNSNLKGISLQLSFATGTDEALVTYNARRRQAHAAVTADTIA